MTAHFKKEGDILEQKKKYSAAGNVVYILKDIFKHKRSLFAAIIITALCTAAASVCTVYLPKTVVELAGKGADAAEISLRMGILFALLGLFGAAGRYTGQMVDGAYLDLRMMYMRRIVSKSMRQNYSRLESEEGQNCYWKARGVVLNGNLAGMIEDIAEMITHLVNFLSFSYIIALLNPLIVLFLIAMSMVTFAFMKRGSRIWESVREERARVQQQTFVLAEDGSSAKKGKDIRLYGMKRLFTDKIHDLAYREMKLYNKQRSGYIEEHFATIGLDFLRNAGAYAYLIYKAANGSISAGDFVLYFGAITSFSSWLGTLTWRIDTLRRNYYDVRYFREFMEYEDPKIENPEKIEGSCPEIVFDNVSFSYDGKKDILKNFSLRIAPGEHVALIGANGAGKSTVVKLLCGFYAPTKGSVKVGGAEMSKTEPDERYGYISAVFQDMCILPHTVAQNISMSYEADKKRAAESLKKAGLEKLVKLLDAPMTKAVSDEGTELSGGENQKLMMARAIYKDAPILILDEPTAALDPIAESETYRKFHEVSKGKSALYISHRLAGTRFCDRIVFLEDGEAKEIGTHDELMRKGGGYAKMFEMQSIYYNGKDGSEGEKCI